MSIINQAVKIWLVGHNLSKGQKLVSWLVDVKYVPNASNC